MYTNTTGDWIIGRELNAIIKFLKRSLKQGLHIVIATAKAWPFENWIYGNLSLDFNCFSDFQWLDIRFLLYFFNRLDCIFGYFCLRREIWIRCSRSWCCLPTCVVDLSAPVNVVKIAKKRLPKLSRKFRYVLFGYFCLFILLVSGLNVSLV